VKHELLTNGVRCLRDLDGPLYAPRQIPAEIVNFVNQPNFDACSVCAHGNPIISASLSSVSIRSILTGFSPRPPVGLLVGLSICLLVSPESVLWQNG